MKAGKFKILFLVFILFFKNNFLHSEDKITTVPLINLENLKPSYEEEEIDTSNSENNTSYNLKNKNKNKIKGDEIIVKIIGLDKITAKTTELNIKIGEVKNFGILEIKPIKCGKVVSSNDSGEAAYIQVKDLTENESKNEKVFVFNGWTFSSSPSLRPLDHPIYDLWLHSCENV
ncbi:MAG: hypothetical protein FD547_000170 [Pelagibacterales bacterium]|jgi:hypothetical protein|nr:hypothetical protein [Pelagibacterales bacterium]